MKRPYHRTSTMSKAEIMLIMILFHDSGYRCLKHSYAEKVCSHMRHLFPKFVSYKSVCRTGKRDSHSVGPVHQEGAFR